MIALKTSVPAESNVRPTIEHAAAHFQPFVDLSTGEMVGAEALVRFIEPDGGVVRVKVIAEGGETREQAFFLHAAGVNAAQGWPWSKAVPPDRRERLLAQGGRVGLHREAETSSHARAAD